MSIDKFMSYVHGYYCSLHVTERILTDIKSAVTDVVRDITKRVGEKDGRFVADEFVPVGSFEEGTKIQNPNEFDFMVILRRLFDKTNVYMGDGCQTGYKMMFLNNKNCRFQDFSINLYNDFWCLSPEYIRSDYTKRLDEVLTEMKTSHIVKKTGVFVLHGQEFLTLKAKWNFFRTSFEVDDVELTNTLAPGEGNEKYPYGSGMHVQIDLMPALEIEDKSPILNGETFPKHFQSLLMKRGCYLVIKSCGEGAQPLCFQISFAAAEVQLMSNLHPLHLRCYKVLKFLLVEGTNINKPFKSISLSSYMLKTAFLYHEYEHKCSKPSFEGCTVEVLLHIREGFARGHFKSFFMRNLNVWGRFYRIPINHCWLPPGITNANDSICRGDWCLIFWFEMWCQILNRALEIFSQIKEQRFRDKALLYYLEMDVDNAEMETEGSEKGGYVTEYKENEMDKFLQLFENLRATMKIVTSKYLEHGSGPRTEKLSGDPPEKETYLQVLPKFRYFLQNIEKLCRTKIDIPETTPDLSNLFEIVYSRD